MNKSIHYAMIGLLLAASAVCFAEAPPVKVYVFAGQSNLDFKLTKADFSNRLPLETEWMASDENDVLYSGWTGLPGQERKNEMGSKLDFLKTRRGINACCEQVLAYRLWEYWKNKNPEQRIAIVHVSKGGTSLYQVWNPQRKAMMFRALDERMDEAKQKLEEMGLQSEGAGFFWWQGESDSWSTKASDAYEELFGELLAHIRGKFESPEMPFVLVRINKALGLPERKNAPADYVSGFPVQLEKVRSTLVQLAENDPHGVWVDIDDQKQKDIAHYGPEAYVTIYQRMGDAYFELLETAK